MLKVELEQRIGYEITNEGYEELNKMYMSCSLDKDQFANLVKSGAKVYKVKQKKVNYKGYEIELNEISGLFEIKKFFIQQSFKTIEEAKDVIQRYVRF